MAGGTLFVFSHLPFAFFCFLSHSIPVFPFVLSSFVAKQFTSSWQQTNSLSFSLNAIFCVDDWHRWRNSNWQLVVTSRVVCRTWTATLQTLVGGGDNLRGKKHRICYLSSRLIIARRRLTLMTIIFGMKNWKEILINKSKLEIVARDASKKTVANNQKVFWASGF